ncbi:superoxide dismutase family protein [Streptomyces adelaidensis]|uniref:superoxide dismutase family protein n=1 Tax=Streptomyces adelaidensis TaxID=2796465 RepID=UPI001904CA9F|nr:superoxide dismutase family protein [Streptomyces adelaidensis]
MVAGMVLALTTALLTATGGTSSSTSTSIGTGSPDGYWMRTDARFAPPMALVPSAAVTYDMELVPAAGWIEVRQHTAAGGATAVGLRVTGLRPGHAYGAHVHQKPCGAAPGDAGGHYQHRPAHDPAHTADAVSAENEVWLDFTADAAGAGKAGARHTWGFRMGEAASVVLHDRPGNSGARVACFTVPFGWAAGGG